MKIAFDIDGCLANFTDAYAARIVKVTGENRFPKPMHIPCWDWDKHYGYTDDQIAATIEDISKDRLFWEKLDPIALPIVFTKIELLSKEHDVYFLTNRFGTNCKQQTEKWLYKQGIYYPTVLIGSNKRPLLDTLKIEFFVDDKLETMNEVSSPKKPHFYLLDTTYNKNRRKESIQPVESVKDALEKAGLW